MELIITLKDRITQGWSFTRAIYLILGGIILVQSIFAAEWIGIVFGAYFTAMGLFRFGCAAGVCYVDNSVSYKEEFKTTEMKKINPEVEDH